MVVLPKDFFLGSLFVGVGSVGVSGNGAAWCLVWKTNEIDLIIRYSVVARGTWSATEIEIRQGVESCD